MAAGRDKPMSLVIEGSTIIDGVASAPIEEQSIWIEEGKIKAIGRPADLRVPPKTETLDVRGKFVIPGLMDANVHLLLLMRLEDLVRYEDRYVDLIAEASQVALRNGLTTVFDTWGPRRDLMTVRDQINSGEIPGSRIFCAGNIIGLDGPLSPDFFPKAMEAASRGLVERINSLWAENVGPGLTWMTPERVAHEVGFYIGQGVDFIKFASSEHTVPMGPSAFLAFSPQCQAAMVAEAHRAGLTAQAHTSSVEALRVSIEAGADIIQHCNITGPTPIPGATLQLLVERKTASTVFPITQRRFDWIREKGDVLTGRIFSTVSVDTNVRNLIQSGAILLLATDSTILPAEMAADPLLAAAVTGEDNLFELGQGHFHWLKAMEEKGFPAMEGLKAATRNIAVAYGKDAFLGTLQPGKIADMLVLDKDPLQSAENYRSIHMILKDGRIVDRSALPVSPILTKEVAESPVKSAASFPLLGIRAGGLPPCCGAF
jgi:imidazolonepropionase-like amidohydrolase